MGNFGFEKQAKFDGSTKGLFDKSIAIKMIPDIRSNVDIYTDPQLKDERNDFDVAMQFEAIAFDATDPIQKLTNDAVPTIVGAEEQKYYDQLKERHELAPERNSASHTKFMLSL